MPQAEQQPVQLGIENPDAPAKKGKAKAGPEKADKAPTPRKGTKDKAVGDKGKLVYLKLSELHPFHTFRAHPFKVRDDAKMQETVASIKANGVMVPGPARPEKDGNGYELIAGHRRHRGRGRHRQAFRRDCGRDRTIRIQWSYGGTAYLPANADG